MIKWEEAPEHAEKMKQLIQNRVEVLESLTKNAETSHDKFKELLETVENIRVYADEEGETTSEDKINRLLRECEEACVDAQIKMTYLKIPIMQWHGEKGIVPG